MPLRSIAAVAIFSLLTVISGCTTSAFTSVDNIVSEAKTRTGMSSGTAVIAIRDDEIVYEGYFGYADIDAQRKVDADTVFYIASTTKAVMGLAVLLAEKRGEVSRETTLQELFPSLHFPNVDAGTVTVHNLLTHTSGMDNEPLTWAMSYTGLHDAASRLDMIASSYPSAAAKLGEFEYSNIGYNIMAVWMDENYGVDWRDTIKSTVLTPLGMNHATGYISEGVQKSWATTEPYSYKVGRGQTPLYLRKSDLTMYSVGLIATARDTARFVMATMNDGLIDGEQVLPAEVFQTQRAMQIETDGGYFDGYAYGWMTGEKFDRRLRLHTGGFSGATASISYMPDEKLGVIVLHNENGLKANWLNGIAEDAVYSALLGETDEEVDAVVRGDIEKLVASAAKAHDRLEREAEQRLAADFSLTLDRTEYLGAYTNQYSGLIEVSVGDSGRFNLNWGALRATGYPGDATDHIDVNFRPGSYDALEFVVDGEGVTGLVFNGVEFTKTR
jgi:CubicO group peptidase (beta-lactamase class C family)